MRLSDSPVVLLDHVAQGRALKRYTSHLKDEISNITQSISSSISPEESRKIALRIENLTHAVESYAKNAAQIHLVCSKTSASLARLRVAGRENPRNSSSAEASLSQTVEKCNEKLGLTERYLLLESGLPRRPWFKHCLQAPGLDLGYAAESFPGIQQALDEADYSLAQEQIDIAAATIFSAADNLVVATTTAD